jgi:hypothetical protein
MEAKPLTHPAEGITANNDSKMTKAILCRREGRSIVQPRKMEEKDFEKEEGKLQ